MKAAIGICLFVLIAIGYAVVSTSDYYEAIQRHSHCLDMVAQGAWPAEAC